MFALTTFRSLAAAGLLALGFAGAASAATINVLDSGDVQRGEVTCSAACSGLDTGPVFGSIARIYPQPAGGQDPDDVAVFLNSIAGTTFTTGLRTNLGTGVLAGQSDESATFFTTALWVALKLGNNYAFIRNDSPGTLRLEWDKTGSGGFGLSNITEFGTAVIPLPAGGLLLLTALGGLGIAARRRRKAQAA